MNIVLDSQEYENLVNDVWLKVDAIIHTGIELANCSQDGRIRYLRSVIDSDSSYVHGLILALGRVGLRSVVRSLRDKIRQRLNKDRSGYQSKVDVFALSNIQSIIVYSSCI